MQLVYRNLDNDEQLVSDAQKKLNKQLFSVTYSSKGLISCTWRNTDGENIIQTLNFSPEESKEILQFTDKIKY